MKIVIDLHELRSVWALPVWVPERIRGALPAEGRLVMISIPSDGSGDGVTVTNPSVLAEVADADAYAGFGVPADVLRAGKRLRWVHSAAAGVGSSLTPEMIASSVVFTNSAGVHGPPMAETVMAMMLHFARGLDLAARAQTAGKWGADAFYAADAPVTEFAGGTVGVVGFGGIGREVARRSLALGARVVALRRGDGATGEVALEGVRGGEVGVAKVLYGKAGLKVLLEESDYLVISAPLTPETTGLIGRGALERMKPSAVLVNVSRGGLVDEAALVDALTSGRLRGAALDVFAQEPLSAGHPLWAAPNVLLTPHVSAVSRLFWEREAALIVSNLVRFQRGETLLNVVDKHAGY